MPIPALSYIASPAPTVHTGGMASCVILYIVSFEIHAACILINSFIISCSSVTSAAITGL